MDLQTYLFWAGLGGLIGALIGYGREQTISGFIVGFLLGPIGWIITFFSLGHRRICPACSKKIPLNYANCPLCHSPLDPPVARRTRLSPFGCLLTLILLGSGLGGLVWFFWPSAATRPSLYEKILTPSTPTPRPHHKPVHLHHDS